MESDLRIVLVGKTGAGKSACGNTILSDESFKSKRSPEAVTVECIKNSKQHGGRDICVIDTPGMCGSMTEKDLKKQIHHCVNLSVPGPHVFLLVIKIDRFTKEEQDAVKWIQVNFGEHALKYTIILFTHADLLKGVPLDDYINESSILQDLVHSCGGRYHAFNNDDPEKRDQVTELLKKIDQMLRLNGQSNYTNEMYRKAQAWIMTKKIARVGIKTGLAVGSAGLVAKHIPMPVLPATALAGAVAGITSTYGELD